jgi:hypothetical protein
MRHETELVKGKKCDAWKFEASGKRHTLVLWLPLWMIYIRPSYLPMVPTVCRHPGHQQVYHNRPRRSLVTEIRSFRMVIQSSPYGRWPFRPLWSVDTAAALALGEWKQPASAGISSAAQTGNL